MKYSRGQESPSTPSSSQPSSPSRKNRRPSSIYRNKEEFSFNDNDDGSQSSIGDNDSISIQSLDKNIDNNHYYQRGALDLMHVLIRVQKRHNNSSLDLMPDYQYYDMLL